MGCPSKLSVFFITFCGILLFIFSCGDGNQGLSFQFNTCVFLSMSHVCSAELDNRVTAERSAGNGCFLCWRTQNSHLMSCAHSPAAKLHISRLFDSGHIISIVALLVMGCLCASLAASDCIIQ